MLRPLAPGAVTLAMLVACTHLPSSTEDRAQEERRYQAGERFCSAGELAVCLDLAESDLRDYRSPGSFHYRDVAILRRAGGKLVRLCDQERVAEACLRIYREYATLFEGQPGPRPRAAYAESACDLGLDDACRPPTTIGRPAGPRR
jgi:hypothetical protein